MSAIVQYRCGACGRIGVRAFVLRWLTDNSGYWVCSNKSACARRAAAVDIPEETQP